MGSRRLAAFAVTMAALAAPGAASAATITVTTTTDGVSGCELRSAISSANTNGDIDDCVATDLPYGDDTVVIPAAVGPVFTTDAGTGAFTPMAWVTSGSLTIDGAGTGSTEIRGTPTNRVFYVANGDNTESITIRDVKISGGNATDAEPGDATGGGIQNGYPASLILDDVVVSGNKATSNNIAAAVNNFADASGGGIYSAGPLTITDSTVESNTALADSINGTTSNTSFALGGGIAFLAGGELKISNTTVAGNTANAIAATAGPVANSRGGGIYQHPMVGGKLTMERSTVSGNQLMSSPIANESTGGGGVLASGTDPGTIRTSTIADNGVEPTMGYGANLFAQEVTLRSTLVADPRSGPNCRDGGLNVSEGFNLEANGSTCTFFNNPTTDRIGVADAGIGPLASNPGGTTQTHALLVGSPAIDTGLATGDTSDQRGQTRPVDFAGLAPLAGGDHSDVGAFEYQAACPLQLLSVPGASCTPATTPPPGGTATTPTPTGKRAAALKKCKKKKGKKRKACKKKAKKLPV